MTLRFTARALAALDLDDLNTFLIALADDPDEPTHSLEFQKALDVDEDDPDSDTYCLVINGGATHYGGVSTCHLHEGLLTVRLDERAAHALHTPGVEIRLDVDQVEYLKLRESLYRLFHGDRSAPTDLVLE
ncbi:Imm10 family immunity protein [Deinococcus sonorensis]|uniref:Imm10 family immunity protein n=1 Tax=Deinococcus sonorensis TaxID=309891 RepID=A0ABV8Y8G3_9DEIO